MLRYGDISHTSLNILCSSCSRGGGVINSFCSSRLALKNLNTTQQRKRLNFSGLMPLLNCISAVIFTVRCTPKNAFYHATLWRFTFGAENSQLKF